MRIAYVATVDIFSMDGVAKKIREQIGFWEDLGHIVHLFCNVKKGSNRQNSHNLSISTYEEAFPLSRLFFTNRFFLKDIWNFKPDVIYLRSELFCPYVVNISKIAPIVMELNSDLLSEYKNEASRGIRFRIRYYYYRITMNIYHKSASGFISVTNEILETPLFKNISSSYTVIPNSVDMDQYHTLKPNNKSGKINLCFITAAGSSWNGLDKVVKLALLLKDKANIHVIGKSDISDFRNLPDNIFFHGFLSRNNYEKIFEVCDVGIGTLALHRNNMNEASPLKVREYIAFGLPTVVAYKDTGFMEKEKPEWLFEIPNCEDNIDKYANDIYEFGLQMRGTRISKSQAQKYIDARYFEQQRIEFLKRFVLSSSSKCKA